MLLPQLLSEILKIEKRPIGNENNSAKHPSEMGLETSDVRTTHPDKMMMDNEIGNENVITNDSGEFSLNQSNPFLDAIKKSRAGDNSGPGVLRQLLSSVLGGGLVPSTGTVGGDPAGVAGPTHVPGTRQDAALNPTRMKDQSQPNFVKDGDLSVNGDNTTIVPKDYSQPSALDPNAIEELRRSLLSDAGQLDPSNPNGLSGRMNDPNSQVDMNNQRNEAMSIEDSVRGFDGSRKANIIKRNQQ